MSHTKVFCVLKGNRVKVPPPPGGGYTLDSSGISGSWLVTVWKRRADYKGDQYTETETEFRNQQGELIATYFESYLSQRKPEPPPEKTK